MISGLNEIALLKARKTISSTFESISNIDEAEISQVVTTITTKNMLLLTSAEFAT